MIVAQLSDIHADGRAGALGRLDRVLFWLKPLRPDAIIVSGDLAEADFETSYREIGERLESFGCPFFVVPGNVDDHGRLQRAFGERFGWASERPLNISANLGDQLRVLGLDVTVEDDHYGDARPVLDWLGAELNSGGPPALIFQHQHPFMCGIDGKDRNMCQGHAELARVIEGARDTVIGLTCGHVHRAMFTRFAGRPATMAPSVAPANRLRLDGKDSTPGDPPGLLLHHIAGDRLVSHVVMVS